MQVDETDLVPVVPVGSVAFKGRVFQFLPVSRVICKWNLGGARLEAEGVLFRDFFIAYHELLEGLHCDMLLIVFAFSPEGLKSEWIRRWEGRVKLFE